MQNYTPNSYQANHIGETDMLYFENNFECLRSMFSGLGSPSNSIAGMTWFDTSNKVLKIRNSVNSKWLGVMYGNENTKMWVHSNLAEDGWVIDSSITDCVLAIKGGTEDYDVTSETVSGTWTQPGCTLTEAQTPSHDHGSKSHSHNVRYYADSGSSATRIDTISYTTYTWYSNMTSSNGGHTHDSVGGDESHDHGDTYRPRAAVGTLQYPDI